MKTILIAEDDPMTAKILKKSIKNMGYFPIVASNGRRAFETLVDNPDISLLVTDVMMPEMSGPELVQMVRGRDSFRSLPIVLTSAVATYEDLKELIESEASFFIKKPIDHEQLESYIQKCLG